MFCEFPRRNIKTNKNFIVKNIRKYSEEDFNIGHFKDESTAFTLTGEPINLRTRTVKKQKTSGKDVNDNKIGFKSLQITNQNALSKHQQVFDYSKSTLKVDKAKEEGDGIKQEKKIKQTTKRKKQIITLKAVSKSVKREEDNQVEETNKYENNEENIILESYTESNLKKEAVEVNNAVNTMKKTWWRGIERFQNKRMDTKEREGVIQDRSTSELSTDVERDIKTYSQLFQETNSCCQEECSTFIGEATRNRKFPTEFKRENTIPKPNETTEDYLLDSYNYLFQRHVDNLNTVISQHNQQSPPSDKTKTQVHIHPTQNCCHDQAKTKSKKKEETEEHKKNKRIQKKQMNVVAEQLQELTLNFEELNNNESLKPVIVFNHVSTVTTDKKLETIQNENSGSRSPSPLLEVPPVYDFEKATIRRPM